MSLLERLLHRGEHARQVDHERHMDVTEQLERNITENIAVTQRLVKIAEALHEQTKDGPG